MRKTNKKQLKTTTKQKILLIMFGIFLVLVILELGLRIGGFVVSSYQRSMNKESFDADYKILCLGESTTVMGGKYSWPALLEVILNNKSSEIKFKVFNEGVGGTNTAFILSRLENNLDKYKPDMVITMMGINDVGLIKYEKNFKVKIILILHDLRIYKLSKLLWTAWKNKIQDNVTNDINVAEEQELIKKEYEEKAREYINLGINYQKQGKFKEAEKMFTKSIAINPYNSRGYIELGWVYKEEGKFKEAEEMFTKAIEIDPYNEDAYNRLVRIYYMQVISDKEIQKFYRQNGFLIQIQNNLFRFNMTKYHYQQLYKELNKKGIKYIAMQYPTLDINELEDMFEGDENIIFVSNEENFKKALETAEYEEYFIDRFAGNFGHCTPEGNRLIAENLANVILKELNISLEGD